MTPILIPLLLSLLLYGAAWLLSPRPMRKPPWEPIRYGRPDVDLAQLNVAKQHPRILVHTIYHTWDGERNRWWEGL